MKRLALLLAATALVLAACTSDGGDDDASSTTAGGDTATTATEGTDGGGTVDPSELPSYEHVDAIGEALQCELEYDGIVDADREYSTCVFEGEQALIYIYTDPSVVADVAAAGAPALVYGANWTVELETPAGAEAAAEATGGEIAPAA